MRKTSFAAFMEAGRLGNLGTGNQNEQQAIAEAVALIDSGDADLIYVMTTKKILGIMKAVAGRVCDNVDGRVVDTALIIRCIAKKAEESLTAILHLVEHELCYPATSLLRQMCDELIFAKFLRSLPREDADEFVRLKTRLDIHDGIEAQENYFKGQQEKYGLPDGMDPQTTVTMPPGTRTVGDNLKTQLKDIGKRLGWDKTPKPTVKYMANRANLKEIHDFFYHASCSSVHASLHHLMRMVWFDPKTGVSDISDRNFARYYRHVALVYGVWIASEVITLVTEEFPGSLPEGEEEILNIWLALVVIPAVVRRTPAIITSEELNWHIPDPRIGD